MTEQKLQIVNRLGLHARAAARFVNTAAAHESDIQVTRDDQTVSGKSIMGLMMLAAAQGSWITVSAEGPDADVALDALATLVAERFGEAE